MEYKVKLFGKINKTYIPLALTSDEVDTMKIRIEQVERELEESEQQVSISRRVVAELQAENERLRLTGNVNCQCDAPERIESARKEAAGEILQILDTFDWACSTYEETYIQSIKAIKDKFGLN